MLNISAAQAYALVRSGELPAIKIGGRGQSRAEGTELEAYTARFYTETRQFVEEHPFGGRVDRLDGAEEPALAHDAGDPDAARHSRSRSA